MSFATYTFHLHGDNIVECERTVALIRLALADITSSFRGPYGRLVCPSYELTVKGIDLPLVLTLYPGFGRWNHDILDLIRRRGGTLREAADVIITSVADGDETPLIALEYCGALPAGNQAWQRSGRAYSFGKAQVPYMYIAELAGYELGEDRVRKAARLPNPAVPFSYVSFSLTNETPTLPVFVTSPGAHESSRATYADVFGETELLALIRAMLLGQGDETATEALRLKALAFVETKANASRPGRTLTPRQWQQAYEALEKGRSLVDFLVADTCLSWAKVAYIAAITSTARKLMDLTAALAIGLTSSDLPMCIVPKKNRPAFADAVQRLYTGRCEDDFLAWLRQGRHLTICWVMGFKPGHDDARPDRGLPPLTRMLIGDGYDLLSVIYGPAPPSAWSDLDTDPRKLMRDNGLWEAILDVSDAILADSATDSVRRHGYLRSHWYQKQARPDRGLVFVEPKPLHIGEHDVDTVIHLLLTRHGGALIFEGMCNPPGGDWSGVSLQPPDRAVELRWLTLPRVSAEEAKRPDHVFQFFSSTKPPILLSVESKEHAASVEAGIGPRLTGYIEALLRTPASIERPTQTVSWTHSTTKLDASRFTMASAVAFISDTEAHIAKVKGRGEVDLLMCFAFANGGESCTVRLIATTPIGAQIAAFMAAIPLEGTGIRVAVEE